MSARPTIWGLGNPVEKYRCTRGHEFETDHLFQLAAPNRPSMIVCLVCVSEFVAEHFGAVTKVNE